MVTGKGGRCSFEHARQLIGLTGVRLILTGQVSCGGQGLVYRSWRPGESSGDEGGLGDLRSLTVASWFAWCSNVSETLRGASCDLGRRVILSAF